MKFKRGEYYIYEDSLLCYNCPATFSSGHSFYDSNNDTQVIIWADAEHIIPATKLDLLLRGLDENIRISGSKTASTGKR